MPSPPRQLTLIIHFRSILDIALIPAAVFFVPEHGGPEPLHVVTRLRIYVFHIAQEEGLQHALIERFRMLMDRLAADGEDGAGLETDGDG